MRAPDSLVLPLPQLACLALLTPLLALAQHPDSPRDAANPGAPAAPLSYVEMNGPAPDHETPSPNVWRTAHDAVAAFPRGHADILAWEKQFAADPAAAPPQPVYRPGHLQGGTP